MKRMSGFFLILLLLAHPLCSHAAKSSLRVASGGVDVFSTSLQQLEKENPKIKLIFDTAPDIHGWLTEQLIEKSREFDLYRLASETNLRQRLIQRGFCDSLALTETQKKTIGSFFPAVRQALSYEEHVFFVPSSIKFPYCFFANPELLAQVGMTVEDLPRNLVDLFAFIDLWNQEYADEFSEITPFYSHGFGYIGINPLAGLVLGMYRDAQLFTHGTLSYDTELFRSLMTNAQEYTVPVSLRGGGDQMYEVPNENECLLYCRPVDTGSFLEQSPAVLVSPLSISEQYESFQPFSLELTFINPYSKNKENAELFLSYYLDFPDPVLLCALSQELAAPVPNPSFEESRTQWIKSLDTAKAKLEHSTPSEKAALEETIEFMQDCLDHQEDYRYRISQASLDNYHEKIVPYLASRGSTPFDTHLINSNIKSLVSQYLDRAIDIEVLVKQLNQAVTLLYLEDQ